MVGRIRIGQGFDVHALVPGRPMVLGGVTIESEVGLLGHSDADALLHAITDAVLGAAGLGDIGRMFPDTDPAYRGADSRRLLAIAMQSVHARGWRVANVDCTVMAERPKITPHAGAMVRCIAELLQVTPDQVNVKGKTSEKLGFVGRGEAIATSAVALLVQA